MQHATLAGFEVFAVNNQNVGWAVVLRVESRGQGRGERQKGGAVDNELTNESVHGSPRNG
jgi:hypothetical protein